ncbi:hypothetical protein [Solemya velesiana gill symbiont]|uniref:Uncharacterized protein n=1 Tax=Solemya velesiana gill symbiont TaxID=1918948 RepID=A0A1T2KXB3_9GAMM|nr:hypothetical protein [Solemya velesiana gill symbiont]OOZ37498.1 hypothetical protein BOW51_02300 [Solemya velesiana gill symbiont]
MDKKGLFLNDWHEGGLAELKQAFGIADHDLHGAEVLLASYARDAYCGEAFVLMRRAGALFEVNASHDSVDGFEGQWEPEDTFIAALRYRMERGRLGSPEGGINEFADELRFLLAELEAAGYR